MGILWAAVSSTCLCDFPEIMIYNLKYKPKMPFPVLSCLWSEHSVTATEQELGSHICAHVCMCLCIGFAAQEGIRGSSSQEPYISIGFKVFHQVCLESPSMKCPKSRSHGVWAEIWHVSPLWLLPIRLQGCYISFSWAVFCPQPQTAYELHSLWHQSFNQNATRLRKVGTV